MDVHVHEPGPSAPFLRARDLFETGYDLDRPVHVHVRDSPDERTWTAHPEGRHVLNISRQAATSAMARELALHEYAHMARHEQAHPSHTQSTEEVLFLALSGTSVERRRVTHCYQIANHMKDIYADDITLRVGPTDKLVSFLESELAAAVADRPTPRRHGPAGDRDGLRITSTADPEMTAVNAAFALALVERHGLVDGDHRLYDLAHAAADDATDVDLWGFKRRFESLGPDPDESEYRRNLVDAAREYAVGDPGRAAD
ncbi:DUF5781 family protein [Halorussus salilacus]|uniref:DUF5781 family protein n=1 Tax=Halorussus salilacus TaxID=2953750 RepID=UPI00209FFC78|nr:DUF5781 family protein [Halorussus salilacus]USZ69361.1 DUF5781 family protein [Halorussus salilacus]